MFFYAEGSTTRPELIPKYAEEETRVLDELRAEGIVKEAFRRTDGHGVVGIFVAESEEELSMQVARLPLVDAKILTFTYHEIIEL